jgi:hypothetical protein
MGWLEGDAEMEMQTADKVEAHTEVRSGLLIINR